MRGRFVLKQLEKGCTICKSGFETSVEGLGKWLWRWELKDVLLDKFAYAKYSRKIAFGRFSNGY
jgi:hypothetical protein